MNGILVVDKPAGMTSRDVVNRLIKVFHTKKIGHTGTLDPLATGVLVVCIGKYTKLVDILTSLDKEYIFTAELGTLTDTLDSTGLLLKEEEVYISKDKIEEVLKQMVGIYEQEVPLYSAVKINGKKLYEYARNNEEVVPPKREVTIHEVELESVDYLKKKTIVEASVIVSKGTYIRSLIRDIAYKLDTVGTMNTLRRTKQGKFKIEDAYSLEEIEHGNYQFLSLKEVLQDIEQMEVTEEEYRKIKNGALLPKKKKEDKILFMYQGEPIALYQTYEKESTYLKPWKML